MEQTVSCYFQNSIGSTVQRVEIPYILQSYVMNQFAGGAISMARSNVWIESIVFEGNFAGFGAAIFVGDQSNVSISNSQFLHEGSNSGYGVLFVNEDCNAQVSNSTFSNNSAGYGVIASFGGTVAIVNGSIFESNIATFNGGAVLAYNSVVHVAHSNFSGNTASISGGVIAMYGGTCYIAESSFSKNTAMQGDGGVIAAYGGTCHIADSSFTSNMALSGDSSFPSRGGVLYTDNITFTPLLPFIVTPNDSGYFHIISHSTFSSNTAGLGGAVRTYGYSLYIADSTFNNNEAMNGGAITTNNGLLQCADSYFSFNNAEVGGVMFNNGGSINIANCTYSNNRADIQSAVLYTNEGLLHIADCTFTDNAAEFGGGVMSTSEDSVYIANSNFSNNVAKSVGGVMYVVRGSLNIADSTFCNNTALGDLGLYDGLGGVLLTSEVTSLAIISSVFSDNAALRGGIMLDAGSQQITITDCNFVKTMTSTAGAIFLFSTSVYFSGHIAFVDNIGSLYAFSCNITFNGSAKFENGMESSNITTQLQEGGALTSILSNVMFEGTSSFTNNQGMYGGAILAIESTISLSNDTVIVSNTATVYGGGVFLHQSDLEINRMQFNCFISSNNATRGGGIYAIGSTINIDQPGTLHLDGNTAEFGGGIYFTGYAKINLLNHDESFEYLGLRITGNQAILGGAVYVDDDTNSGACSTASTDQSLPSSLLGDISTTTVVNAYFF